MKHVHIVPYGLTATGTRVALCGLDLALQDKPLWTHEKGAAAWADQTDQVNGVAICATCVAKLPLAAGR